VKVVDANVLLYSVNSDAPQHTTATNWIDRALSGAETVAFGRPLTSSEALDAVEAWLAQPSAVVVEPTRRHLGTLRGLVAATGAAGNLVNDAHMAAICVEHDAEMVTFDADFTRFDGLRLQRLS